MSNPAKKKKKVIKTDTLKLKWHDYITTEALDDGLFLFYDSKKSVFYKADEIAALFCKQINGKNSYDKIINSILRLNIYNEKDVVSSCKKFYAYLSKKKLIC